MVTIFKESREDIDIHITARISDNGDLLIEGVDSGTLVKQLKGDWDYEYFLTVKKPNKESLIALLQRKNIKVHTDQELLHWFKDNYADNNAFSAIDTFLTQEKIAFETFFWE